VTVRSTVLAALAATVLCAAAPVAAPDAPVADAAQQGNIEGIRALVRGGADVNAAQGDGMTALHWAALNHNPEMAELLIYAGANVAATTRLGGYTALHLASAEGQAEVVLKLLDAGSEVGTPTSTGVSAIHLAAEAGSVESIRVLLENGAEVNAADVWGGRTPLMFAVARNRVETVGVLLAAGADPSLTSRVVDYAERSGTDRTERQRRERMIEAARPAEPEEPDEPDEDEPAAEAAEPPAPAPTPPAPADTTPSPTAPAPAAAPSDSAAPAGPTAPRAERERPLSYDQLVGKQGGLAPLHWAARDGRAEAARILLDAGADVDQPTAGDESTPLVVATINGNFDLAMMLLERGADPNLASEDGAAPLFTTINNEWALRTWYPQPTAARQQKTSYLELMKALLDAGADPNARVKTHIWYTAYNTGRMGVDFDGVTAFWRAAYSVDLEAMRLLVSYGADPNIPSAKPPGNAPSEDGPSDSSDEEDKDPSGLPPVPTGGPAVHPLHAATGVGYGTSRVGQQHRHVPGGWLPAVKYLVEELGVDVNVRDHEGFSAVHNAAARGDNEVIRYLVEHGADVTFVSRRGQTTIDMANGPQQRVQPFPETIALLESLGAKNSNKCISC
jgi:ankyrin repeat protein